MSLIEDEELPHLPRQHFREPEGDFTVAGEFWPDASHETNLEPHVLERAARLALSGACSKAASTLSRVAAAPATPETAELLQRLHPTAADPPAYPAAMGTLEEFPPWKARAAIMAFAPRAGAGPSGLSPDALLQGLAIHGGPFAEAVAAVVHRIAQGAVPPEVRPYFFGAQLAALEKKGGGVRPIAAGETLRRVAARLLSWRVAAQVRPVLSAVGQEGWKPPSSG